MNSTSSPSNAANELRHKGDTWNVSRVYDDPVTGRKVRQVTAAADGEFNIHPSFDSLAFTADGEYFIFSTAHGSIAKGGRSALFKCCTATGDITQLTDASDDFLSWLSWALGGIRKGQGIYAQTACIAPKSRWAVYFKGPGMRKVHLDTLAEQVLLPDIGQWAGNTISVDPSETFALVPLLPMHPDVVLGRKPAEPWFRGADTVYAAAGGMRTRLLQVPMHGGDSKILFEYQGISSQHNPICPTDSDLALVTRDLPPDFPWMGDGGKVNRYWILRLSSGKLTPIRPHNSQRFQVHAVWSADGQYVFYHGPRSGKGWYIGVADRAGNILREYDFPDAKSYGHVGADPCRPNAIVLDGDVTPDMLQWLYWDADAPRFEPIARHATDWSINSAGLYDDECADPHPHIDPTGRWLVFQAGRCQHSDLFVVQLEK